MYRLEDMEMNHEYVRQKLNEIQSIIYDLKREGYVVESKEEYVFGGNMKRNGKHRQLLVKLNGKNGEETEKIELSGLHIWNPQFGVNNGEDSSMVMCSNCRKLYERPRNFKENYYRYSGHIYCLDCLFMALQLDGLNVEYTCFYEIDGTPVGEENRFQRRRNLFGEELSSMYQKIFEHFGVEIYKE